VTAESVWLHPAAVDTEGPLSEQRPREVEHATGGQRHGRMVPGGAFIFDEPAQPPAIWGRDSAVVWSEGEPFMITGPPGVGKTTLGQQVVAGRCGFLEDVLGMPVAPGRRVLYRPVRP
jgi:hypothetical protein